MGTWQSLKLSRDENGHFECWFDNVLMGTLDGIPEGLERENDWLLTIGNFNGYIDEVRISGLPGHGAAPPPPGGGGGDGDPPVTGDPLVRPFRTPYVSDDDTIALYHFDGDYQDSGPNGFHLTLSGSPQRVAFRSGYEISTGEFVRFSGHGDQLEATLSPPTAPVIFIAPALSPFQDWLATGGFQVESDPLARSENGSPFLLSYALEVSATLVVPADSVFKVFRSGDRLHVTYPRPRAETE